MKREEVKAICPDITDEQLGKIIDLGSRDVGGLKNQITALTTERDTLNTQLSEANEKIKSYTDMMFEGRQIAEQRMVANAQAMGADAVVSMRFDGSSVMEGAIDFLAYGTAVRFVQ